MARFRYRLQAALDHALALERDAKAAVAMAAVALDDELAALARAEASVEEASSKLIVSGGSIVGYELSERGRHLDFTERALKQQRERVALARRRLAQARAELAPLAQRRSALERHRERKREEHLAAEDRAEAAELDETNMLRSGAVTTFA